jgi:thymidylate kinase
MSCKAAGFKYMSEQHPPWLETFSALVDPLGKIVGGANKTQTNTRRNPRARVFCFSGVDGVGKSFLLNKVQVLIRSAGYRPTRAWLRYNHYFTKLVLGLSRMMGLTVIQCVGARVVHKHHRFQSTPFVARLFLFTKVLDTYITWILKIWLPTHLDRKKIILCDRYIYDILVDLMVETGIADLENTLAGELLLWLCGEPTETIILTAPRELLLARRSENALDPYLDYRISLYSAFADKHCLPKIVSIDPEQSLNEAIQRTSLSGYIKKGHQTSNPNH